MDSKKVLHDLNTVMEQLIEGDGSGMDHAVYTLATTLLLVDRLDAIHDQLSGIQTELQNIRLNQ